MLSWHQLAFLVIQDDVQDGIRRIVSFRKFCELVNFSSIFLCNTLFQPWSYMQVY